MDEITDDFDRVVKKVTFLLCDSVDKLIFWILARILIHSAGRRRESHQPKPKTCWPPAKRD